MPKKRKSKKPDDVKWGGGWVCTKCGREYKDGCALCHGTGLIKPNAYILEPRLCICCGCKGREK